MNRSFTDEQMLILEGLERAYLKVMLAMYSSTEITGVSVKKSDAVGASTNTSGCFGLYAVENDLTCIPNSDFFVGVTKMYYKEILVWWMTYDGSYPSEVIPFLKQAKLKAYTEMSFVGGRGPECFVSDDPYQYINSMMWGDIKAFHGDDQVWRKCPGDDELLGTCRYRGRILF